MSEREEKTDDRRPLTPDEAGKSTWTKSEQPFYELASPLEEVFKLDFDEIDEEVKDRK